MVNQPARPPHFNAASHGTPAPAVYDVMSQYLRDEAAMGPENAAAHWLETLGKCRESAAGLLAGEVAQIGFQATTGTAWHAVMSKIDLCNRRVLVSAHEWGDYYRLMQRYRGVTVEVLPGIDFEAPDLSGWAARIDEDVAAICVPLVTSAAGFRYPVAEIAALARPQGCKLIVDAAQALGQIEVDVGAMGCDAVVATCRKWLRGPRQSALVWVNAGWKIDGRAVRGGDFEPALRNPAITLGLGAAIRHLQAQGLAATQAAILQRAGRLRDWAAARSVPVLGGAAARSGIVSLVFAADLAGAVGAALHEHGIIAKMPEVADTEPLARDLAPGHVILRLSPHVYTSEADIDLVTQVLDRVIGQGFAPTGTRPRIKSGA
ncbi:MAG: aminotransferase class V-fold PLP-dependent enzyme [Paracoccaceae bacterium]